MRLPDRFWAKVRKTDACWLWTAALVAWLILWMEILPFNGMLRGAFDWVRFYDHPAGYAAFMSGITDGETQILGRPFSWGLLLYYLFGLFVFNILGEELWWRGYILPRQELAFGARTWIIHGTLWALFHFFYHTTLGVLVSYLPTTLGIAYVAQRTRSTWPGIIGMVSNLTLPLFMLSRLLADPPNSFYMAKRQSKAILIGVGPQEVEQYQQNERGDRDAVQFVAAILTVKKREHHPCSA